jgi:hypothetical protein
MNSEPQRNRITTANNDTVLHVAGYIWQGFMCHPNSTSIFKWEYEPEFQLLTVNYKSDPWKKYAYAGVGYEVLVGLLTTKSVGSFIAKTVKPNYELLT